MLRNNNKLCVLAVDDEEINLGIMEEHLQRSGYTALLARSGEEALRVFYDNANSIDIVLLDRMMPGMDGIEVLRHIKKDEQYKHIPIIMQTAAANTNEVVQGIEAGAYYYLTKPYDKQTFLAIVNSAAQYVLQFKAFAQESYKNFLLLDCSVSSHFRINEIEQCNKLSIFLGKICPYSEESGYGFAELSYGFSELLTNAIEHGNLEIGYDEKSQLLEQGKDAWMNEIKRRKVLPQYKDRVVNVYFQRLPDAVHVTIEDDGKGFDWQRYLEIDPMRITDSHGRGIAMANVIFDDLIYENNGSKAICVIQTQKKSYTTS
jgi:CheY-like chemotaxis protein